MGRHLMLGLDRRSHADTNPMFFLLYFLYSNYLHHRQTGEGKEMAWALVSTM